MASRILSCPSAKQFVGKKGWLGFAQGFNFPGFKACWQYTYTYTDGIAFKSGSVGWVYGSCDGGALTASRGSGNFNQGDLVVLEWPAIGPIEDTLTGINQSYPKKYRVYVCIAPVTGSTTGPDADTAHFAAWDFKRFNFGGPGGTLQDVGGDDDGGPSGWPMSMGSRLLGGFTVDTAHLEVTVTTTLANFPLYPATVSGMTALLGSVNDTANVFPAGSTILPTAASGTFAYQWQFPNNYDGTTPTYTAPGTAPTTAQSNGLFPIVTYGYGNVSDADDGMCEWQPYIDGTYTLQYVLVLRNAPAEPAHLVSWSFSSTALVFEFAAWSWSAGEHQLASAPGTITQTIALTGATYSLSDVAAQATTLMNAVAFGSVAWGTSWTNAYDHTGALVTTQNVAFDVTNSITCSCRIGTEVKWGAAVNGLFLTESTDVGVGLYCSKALVDICGPYCQRLYNCPTVTCTSGTVDGFAPVEIDPPGTAGESQAIYASCQCS
jgi:hypothetical protein